MAFQGLKSSIGTPVKYRIVSIHPVRLLQSWLNGFFNFMYIVLS